MAHVALHPPRQVHPSGADTHTVSNRFSPSIQHISAMVINISKIFLWSNQYQAEHHPHPSQTSTHGGTAHTSGNSQPATTTGGRNRTPTVRQNNFFFI